MNKKEIIKFIILIIIITLLIITIRYFLDFDLIKIKEIINKSGIWGPLAFIATCSLTILFFIPLTSLDLAAGLLFSVFNGVLYITVASTLSAILLFWLARLLGQSFVEKIIERRFPKLIHYDKKISQNEFMTAFFFRIIPIFPFQGMSLILGLSKISFAKYLLGTIIGALPWTIIYVYFGHALIEPNPLHIIIATLIILIGLDFYFYSKKKFGNLKK